MNSIRFRSITSGIFIFSSIVWSIVLVFSILALYVLWKEDIALGVGIIGFAFDALLGALAFLALSSTMKHYLAKVCISRNTLKFTQYPFGIR